VTLDRSGHGKDASNYERYDSCLWREFVPCRPDGRGGRIFELQSVSIQVNLPETFHINRTSGTLGAQQIFSRLLGFGANLGGICM
jgi:hypothetical protein